MYKKVDTSLNFVEREKEILEAKYPDAIVKIASLEEILKAYKDLEKELNYIKY